MHKHETARWAHCSHAQYQKGVRKMRCPPHRSSDETQRTGRTWPVPGFTVKRSYLNREKTGGQGTTQHPGREARREQGSCRLGVTLHSTAPHRRVPGWTTSQRCTQAASAPACPGLDPCRSSEFSPSINKNDAEKNREGGEKIHRTDSGI